VYNERYVAKRLIAAVARLDYPRDRLHIQVLDDSDDVTTAIIAQAVSRYRAEGLHIDHLRRASRAGYKGGALAHGLQFTESEYIAIFDADFLPPPGVLREVLPHFQGDDRLGCVQCRWGHTNAESSWLTRAQAAGIDGHFSIEQETRSAKGLFLNFNGTAGVWRRACIEDAGGWQSDTLTEDLDLSYRAQLHGWKLHYLPEVSVPGELPAFVSAYKRQQFRWAKGSIQTARKLLGSLWRASIPLKKKIAGSIHLTSYSVHPLILFNLLLTLPALYAGGWLLKILPLLTTAALGPILMYWVALGKGGLPTWKRIQRIFVLLLLGMGMSVNNTRAVLEALLGVQSPFLRTPKYNLTGKLKRFQPADYKLPIDLSLVIETLLAGYSLALMVAVVRASAWNLAPWLFLYTAGYTFVAGSGLWEHWGRRLRKPGRRGMRPEIHPVEDGWR